MAWELMWARLTDTPSYLWEKVTRDDYPEDIDDDALLSLEDPAGTHEDDYELDS